MTTEIRRIESFLGKHDFRWTREGDTFAIEIPWRHAVTGESGVEIEYGRTPAEIRTILGY